MREANALRDFQAALGMGEDGLRLLAGHAREPGEKIIDAGAVFKILEQGLDGNTRSLEQPSATNLAGHAFDGWA